MWNVKTKIIPVIRGATETISVSFRHYLSNIPGKHEIKKLQNKLHWALHSYCGKNTNAQVQNIIHIRNSITCSKNCKYRTVATLYTPETWFV